VADTTLILGIAGVLGTLGGSVSGAAIAARATAGVERRSGERQAEADAAALKGAARLVWIDLAVADANLAWAALRRRWDPAKVQTPTEAWEAYRDRLALGITDGAGVAGRRASDGGALQVPRHDHGG
jgi:hypothetical protein